MRQATAHPAGKKQPEQHKRRQQQPADADSLHGVLLEGMYLRFAPLCCGNRHRFGDVVDVFGERHIAVGGLVRMAHGARWINRGEVGRHDDEVAICLEIDAGIVREAVVADIFL